MVCSLAKTTPLARSIRLISKHAARRITLGVRLSMMQFYSRTMAPFKDPVLEGRPLRSIRLSPGFFQYRMPMMQLNVGEIT
jgi:hypothetical protein